ncbi:hypothetical protein [Halopseudomonas oceani]|uniref:hypothetical protein n=1 Tax=Halopseudomonas oceani TaxID=1708783 RepID=UPI002AA72128|nr:hypothetical protein [Halopseudomonas oceani]
MCRFNLGLTVCASIACCLGMLWCLSTGAWSSIDGNALIAVFIGAGLTSVIYGLALIRLRGVVMAYAWVLVAYLFSVALGAIFAGLLGVIPYVMEVEPVSLLGALDYLWISAAVTGLPMLGITAFTFYCMARRRRAALSMALSGGV